MGVPAGPARSPHPTAITTSPHCAATMPGWQTLPALLVLLTLTTATTQRIDIGVVEVEGSGQGEIVEILETVETEDIDQTGDIAVTADEPSNQIKPENIDKCDKCLKSTFRYRHDGFCGKCVANNIIDVNEQQRLNDAMRCKKCRKPKFRSRHLLFCSDTCPDQPTTPATTTTITTSTSTTTASTTNPIVEKY